MAFNASVVAEAKHKFKKGIVCKTLHALAYQYVIGNNKVQIKDFTPRCITEKELETEERAYIVHRVNKFFNSQHLSLSFFDKDKELGKIAIKYIQEMIDGKRNPSFGFILKWFHLQLANGTYRIPTYDFLCLDESGDTTGCSVEIFNLIPATRKFMFGDLDQNIYGFMHTVNGFELVKQNGEMYHMTQSFRVKSTIAEDVQYFLQTYLKSPRKFEGVQKEGPITSIAYISRTNGAMIARMMDLIEDKTPFKTLRKPSEIFSLALTLMNISKPEQIYKEDLQYLKTDYATYINSTQIQKQYKTFFLYLENQHPYDIQLLSAIKLLRKHSYSEIYNTYSIAKQYFEDTAHYSIILTTAFVAKGGEWDSVYIEDDINDIVDNIKEKIDDDIPITEEEKTELRLAYVAATRCKYELHNAKFLSKD